MSSINILKKLESEAISIIRDSYSKSHNPVMMYSIGKDSSVLLHLARKAFFPSQIPFPLLHIDTQWKFKEMIRFRNHLKKKLKLKIIVYTKKEGKKLHPQRDKNYTDVVKTKALKEALDKYQFDVIYGGARRDEEASRSKEKIVSHRSIDNRWDPKSQSIEPWLLFNTHKEKDESFRVFPISNWTELNIWEYIYREEINIVPLYFAKKRKVVVSNNQIFLLDDKRFKFRETDEIKYLSVRFRTLGCYPLTSGIESNAKNIKEIIKEIKKSDFSERSGRLIDYDKLGSMELKKRQGYF